MQDRELEFYSKLPAALHKTTSQWQNWNIINMTIKYMYVLISQWQKWKIINTTMKYMYVLIKCT